MPLENLQLSDDVVARELSGELMLLDLASGKYFGLNAVGARLWQLLEEGQNTAQAREIMLDEFDVTPERLDGDLADLIGQLVDAGLAKVD
ncbi:MAG: PqqD family protein [Novosphingobium sp.]|nr:PqqD family protein [Novosphingobium sp.]